MEVFRHVRLEDDLRLVLRKLVIQRRGSGIQGAYPSSQANQVRHVGIPQGGKLLFHVGLNQGQIILETAQIPVFRIFQQAGGMAVHPFPGSDGLRIAGEVQRNGLHFVHLAALHDHKAVRHHAAKLESQGAAVHGGAFGTRAQRHVLRNFRQPFQVFKNLADGRRGKFVDAQLLIHVGVVQQAFRNGRLTLPVLLAGRRLHIQYGFLLLRGIFLRGGKRHSPRDGYSRCQHIQSLHNNTQKG